MTEPTHFEMSLPDHREALEARIAFKLAARLNEAAEQVPHDIAARLRFAREQAMARAVLARREAVAPVVQSGGSLALAGPPAAWWRFVSLIPLAVLVAGLFVIQQHHDREQISVAAEIDSALLADELPPSAYRDPGFGAFLQAQVGH